MVCSRSDNEFAGTAPRSGVVVEKHVPPGQAGSPDGSGAAMGVADLSSVWVVADLFEAQATQVRQGARAEVSSPSLPDLRLDGRVEMVSSVVDPSRHTVPIRVRLSNAERVLRPNVYARLRFCVTHNGGTIAVQGSTLLRDCDNQ